MDRRVTSPKRVTSPTWGPPPPCKQALNLSAVLKKSTPAKFAFTCHFQQIGINATKIVKTEIHFKTDVFAAVAVVDAKAP